MKHTLKQLTAALLVTSVVAFLSSCASAGGPGGGPTSPTGVKAYPLDTCIVTDNDLGSMGDEQRIVYKGQEIKFCCEPCVDKFRKNPEKFLQKIR